MSAIKPANKSADQGEIGRVVGLSLAGLWLAVSLLAALAVAQEPESTAVAAIESGTISTPVASARN
jgi:hypothetical protein